MEIDLLEWLSANLVRFGPGVLFLACLLETAIFVGLVLPVEPLILLSAALATRGVFDPLDVVAVAVAGAFVGDQLGFMTGRFFIARTQPPGGRIAQLWRRAFEGIETLIRRWGVLGISVARVIPFVRTIMPWFAGRSGMSWPRFLLFDILGVTLWGIVNVGGGFLVGEGWREIAREYGEVAGIVAVVLVLVLIAIAGHLPLDRLHRERAERKRS